MAHTSTASSDTIISALATIHPKSNEMEPKMWMDRAKKVHITSWDDSITSVLQCCHAFSSQEVGVVFIKMLSVIELAVKCQSLLHSSTDVSSLHDIYAAFVAPLSDGKLSLHTRGTAKPKSNPKAVSKVPSSSTSTKKFSAADTKKLAELQKAQKAAQTAEEADKTKALVEQKAQADRGQQSSRPLKCIRKSGTISSDEEEPTLDMVGDLLTFNADDEEDNDEDPEEPPASQN
ncbi:hypothetical protein BDR07DRAFT_1489807 [Suillus spraguei]|nr:hypothetical protein BDR07DRAFT_1489807 [Suillus spraguei]